MRKNAHTDNLLLENIETPIKKENRMKRFISLALLGIISAGVYSTADGMVPRQPVDDSYIPVRVIVPEVQKRINAFKEALKKDPTVQRIKELIEVAGRELSPEQLKHFITIAREIVHNASELAKEKKIELKQVLRNAYANWFVGTSNVIDYVENKGPEQLERSIIDYVENKGPEQLERRRMQLEQRRVKEEDVNELLKKIPKLSPIPDFSKMTIDQLLARLKEENPKLHKELLAYWINLTTQPIAFTR